MQRRYRKFKPQQKALKQFNINEQIKNERLLVVDENGGQLGLLDRGKAIALAREKELDLIEVSPLSNPPVAKIMDYGQYKYENEKKMRKAKAHQKVSELKSIRLSFRIKGQDLENKQKQARKFLSEGHKVKIEIILRGREKAHKNLALENLKKFVSGIGQVKTVEPIESQGGQITTTIDN